MNARLMNQNFNISSQLSDPIQYWCQGDFAYNVGGFSYGSKSDRGEPYKVFLQNDDVVGLIVVSQTCDIVRRTGGRYYVTVCPLIEIDAYEIVSAEKGKRPYLAYVEHTESNVFADFRRFMSIHKDLVAQWKRVTGFTTESKKRRFAAALERKFGLFAFPDEFNAAIDEFRRRVWTRHDKTGSPFGAAYRSLREIRFLSSPSWDAEQREITVFAIINPATEELISRDTIAELLERSLETVEWPEGFRWSNQRFVVCFPDEINVSDYITSIPGDFDFLCY